MIEITEAGRGGRWGTINTKLAAALMVYGFRLCQEQPFNTVASSREPGKTSTTINFVPDHPGVNVTTSTPQDWDVAWRDYENLRLKTGRYIVPPDWRGPFMVMRRALDTRQWFAAPVDRAGKPSGAAMLRLRNEPMPRQPFKTEDALLVVCLLSLGLNVFKVEGARFVFDALKVGSLQQEYLDDGANVAIQWAKRACVQQEALVWAIRHPSNVPSLHLKVGSKVAFIPENCPPSVREPLTRLLNT